MELIALLIWLVPAFIDGGQWGLGWGMGVIVGAILSSLGNSIQK